MAKHRKPTNQGHAKTKQNQATREINKPPIGTQTERHTTGPQSTASTREREDKPMANLLQTLWCYIRRFWQYLTSHSEWLMVSSTVIMAVFTGLLWDLNRDSNRNNVAVQRAFVTLAEPRLTSQKTIQIQPDETRKFAGLTFTVNFENGGTTPATGAIGKLNQGIFTPDPNDPKKRFLFPESDQVQLVRDVLGPKGKSGLTARIPASAFTRASAETSKSVYLWGWVMYRDIFPKTPPRLTAFCLVIYNFGRDKADITDPDIQISYSAMPCPSGKPNCFDELCSEYPAMAQRYTEVEKIDPNRLDYQGQPSSQEGQP